VELIIRANSATEGLSLLLELRQRQEGVKVLITRGKRGRGKKANRFKDHIGGAASRLGSKIEGGPWPP
jgi:hypothetical protein